MLPRCSVYYFCDQPESGEIVKTYGSDDGVIGPDDVDFCRWELVLDFYHDWPGGRFDADGKLIEAAQLTPGLILLRFQMMAGYLFLNASLVQICLKSIPLQKRGAVDHDELGPGCGLNGMDWGPDNDYTVLAGLIRKS